MKEILKQFITQELLANEGLTLHDEDNLLLDGMIDSLGILRLVAFVEQTFQIQIPYEDITIENFNTVNSLATYLQTHHKVRGASVPVLELVPA